MKKIGSNFHRILNEEIIKFLNETQNPPDTDLKEKYKAFLDDPIYAAYAGAPAPSNPAPPVADTSSKDSAESDDDPSVGPEHGTGNDDDSSATEEESPEAGEVNQSSDPRGTILPAVNDEDDEYDTSVDDLEGPTAPVNVSQPADTDTDTGASDTGTSDTGTSDTGTSDTGAADSALGNDDFLYTADALNGEAPGAGAGAGGLGERASAARENKKIDRHSLSFLLEGWEQDGSVKSQTQKSKKDLKLIDIIFDSSRVLSPHAQKYDKR